MSPSVEGRVVSRNVLNVWEGPAVNPVAPKVPADTPTWRIWRCIGGLCGRKICWGNKLAAVRLWKTACLRCLDRCAGAVAGTLRGALGGFGRTWETRCPGKAGRLSRVGGGRLPAQSPSATKVRKECQRRGAAQEALRVPLWRSRPQSVYRVRTVEGVTVSEARGPWGAGRGRPCIAAISAARKNAP